MSQILAPEKMVRMANQIAMFFASQPGEAGPQVAAHIRDFWEPRMRAQLIAYIDENGEGLAPAVLRAAPLLRED